MRRAPETTLVYVVSTPLTAWALLRGQLEFMRRAGFRVVLVSSPGRMLDETASREGVEALAVRIRREPSPFADAFALGRLERLMRRLAPQVTNVSTPKAALLGGLAARAARVPARVYVMRGIRAEGLRGARELGMRALERLSCAAAHRVLCVSASVRARALQMRLAPAAKLSVIGPGSSNGVDTERLGRSPEVLLRAGELRSRLGIPEGALVIGFVGRLARDKGVAELLAAFGGLRAEFPGLRLLLVGEPDRCGRGLAPPLDRTARAEGVVAVGFLEDTAPAYALMDVLVLPSYREGFPNSALEAAAMGLPVVASRVTGCVDAVVDGVTGRLVPPRDPGALAGAIRAYLRDPEMRARHGQAGRERAIAEFRPERIWRAILAEYVELLGRRGIPVPEGARAELESARPRPEE